MFSQDNMKISDWWLFFILMAIPLVNFIMFLVLLFSSTTNKSLKNYIVAIIIPYLIIIGGILALFGTGFFAAMIDAMNTV